MPAVVRGLQRLFILVAACAMLGVLTTPAPVVAQAPDPSSALLRLADLPAGWEPADDATVDEEDDAVPDPCNDGPTVDPLAVAVAGFQRPGEGAFLFHAVAIFASPAEAALAMRYIREDYEGCGDFADSSLAFSPLPLPPLGDESFALRVSEDGIFEMTELDLVAERRGPAISLLAVFDAGSSQSSTNVEPGLFGPLTSIADQRLAQLTGAGMGKSK